jgi:hypothetical protein
MDDPHLSKEGMALRAEPMVTKEGAIVQLVAVLFQLGTVSLFAGAGFVRHM